MPTNARQFLINFGFDLAGSWELSGDIIVHRIQRYDSQSGILYAFVTGDDVLYIGKSVRKLSARMHGYQRPGPTQRTNIANHANIKKLLAAGNEVKILVFTPKEQMEYRGLPVSLAAGLEDVLIERLHPIWNRTGSHAGRQW